MRGEATHDQVIGFIILVFILVAVVFGIYWKFFHKSEQQIADLESCGTFSIVVAGDSLTRPGECIVGKCPTDRQYKQVPGMCDPGMVCCVDQSLETDVPVLMYRLKGEDTRKYKPMQGSINLEKGKKYVFKMPQLTEQQDAVSCAITMYEVDDFEQLPTQEGGNDNSARDERIDWAKNNCIENATTWMDIIFPEEANYLLFIKSIDSSGEELVVEPVELSVVS
ncbi:MAG: hypothetical protein V1725_06275 [archaeon]